MLQNKSAFCVKSELEEQRGNKVVIVMLIEFDHLLLDRITCVKFQKYGRT